MDASVQTAIAKAFDVHTAALGCTVRLPLSGKAYCGKDFDAIYEKTAKRLGRRPVFTVGKAFGTEGMIVATTPEDRIHAEHIIRTLEKAVA